MVMACGVDAEVGETDNQLPPEAVALKFRVPELAVTLTELLTLLVVPAFAVNVSVLGLAMSEAPLAEAA
jgi:hypothetical protein